MTPHEHGPRIVSVNRSATKGTSKKPVSEIRIGGFGVEDDAHAGPGHRQVSLLAMESIAHFSAESGQAFEPGDFAENITTAGLAIAQARLLDRIRIGADGPEAVLLEVTQIGKRCHGECAIYQKVGRCVMPKEGVFCRVLQGGVVHPGASLALRPRVLKVRILTLSDRASRGEYEDQSGPRLRRRLEDGFGGKPWPLEIRTAVLPDDEEPLRAALKAAREDCVDLLFTTGGTGIGPRDITPDVVGAMADKLIPGIMEHIRLKYGADKPRALISRSLAAVMGQTLVYALPGSVRAVDEYMTEIVKTLEHSLCMVHGLDAH